jgi:hypothetical protein
MNVEVGNERMVPEDCLDAALEGAGGQSSDYAAHVQVVAIVATALIDRDCEEA